MPTYVYECQQCSKVFEIDQRIVEDPLTKCPYCEDGTVKRLIQPTAVMFKGSGFYVNDVAKAAPAAEPAAPAAPEVKEAAAPAATPAPASESKTD